MAKSIQDHRADDVDFLLAALELGWVDEHVPEIRDFQDVVQASGGRQTGSRTFHPLAVSASNYLAAPDAEAAFQSMGENFLRLAMAGSAVRILDGVPGLDARVKSLTGGDDALYYSTEFELISAALYVSKGHGVEFVPESDTPTFDLLVDDTVEVECKQATPVTQAQRQAAGLWTLLDRRLRKVLDRHDGVFFVHGTVPDLPDRRLIDEILGEIRQLAEKGVASAHQTHREVQYHYTRMQPKMIKNGIGGEPPRWFPGQADHLKIEVSATLDNSAGLSNGSACFLAFDSRKQPPDPGVVIVDQLRKALRQFTGDRPAVAHADITGALQRSRRRLSDTEVAPGVRSWLERHAEVTAVNILAPASDAATAPPTFHLERSPNSARPLPTPFLGID